MTNVDVTSQWARGRRGTSGNMRTDGADLFSYWLKIGHTDERGRKVLADFSKAGGGFYSVTTSRHVSLARGAADAVISPDEAIARKVTNIFSRLELEHTFSRLELADGR